MNLTSLLSRFAAGVGSSGLLGTRGIPQSTPFGPEPADQSNQRALYSMLRAYYQQNALYETLTSLLRLNGTPVESLKGLRNPAYRVVEFHAAHLWPGTLPDALEIVAGKGSAKLDAPIRQVWEWSNWGAQKQVAAREISITGDLFIKVVQTEDRQRVYFQLVRGEYVSDLDTDPRGFLTYIRVDVPVTERQGDRVERLTNTEVWTKESLRIWRHKRGDAPLDQLGTPFREEALESFGIDFVPFVHAKFKDIGEPRGVGAYTLQLDKIDEASRQATDLYQMLFRGKNNLWALQANGTDATGRPLPAPRIGTASPTGSPNTSAGTLEIGSNTLIALPGNSSLQSLIPQLPYGDALAILQDYLTELEDDLPELGYSRMRDQGEVSGRAVRLMLSGAVDRALELRGNAESGLVRADQMALTLGANAGLEMFANLGTFEAGDFAHSFAPRDVLPTDELEIAQTDQTRASAAQIWVDAGRPLEDYLAREMDWSKADLKALGKLRLEAIARDQQLAADDMPPGAVPGGPGGSLEASRQRVVESFQTHISLRPHGDSAMPMNGSH